jgi:hypothetical protein
MYNFFRDYPSEYPCHVVNMELWQEFVKIYVRTTGRAPISIWTEAEVVQWLDTNTELKWRIQDGQPS